MKLVTRRLPDGVGEGKEVRELRSNKQAVKNSHGDVKYSIGNGVTKELIHMTMDKNNGGGIAKEVGGLGREGQKRKNQDNCNSVINKI